VLLPSDTHRKPITSSTAVLLPFVIELSFLPFEFIGLRVHKFIFNYNMIDLVTEIS
jgi:hypothetical protein